MCARHVAGYLLGDKRLNLAVAVMKINILHGAGFYLEMRSAFLVEAKISIHNLFHRVEFSLDVFVFFPLFSLCERMLLSESFPWPTTGQISVGYKNVDWK
jgi:hypothetical protein